MRVAVLSIVAAIAASACTPPPTPAPEPPPPSTAVRDSLAGGLAVAKNYVTQAAEQVPEKLYSYRATPDVRTLGQLFAHVADGNYLICGTSSGETRPEGSVEQTATTKAAIQAALAESFVFCERAFEAVNDTTGGEPVRLFDRIDSTRLGALAINSGHVMEHYGNIVTYMRLNKMVPPSSQQ